MAHHVTCLLPSMKIVTIDKLNEYDIFTAIKPVMTALEYYPHIIIFDIEKSSTN